MRYLLLFLVGCSSGLSVHDKPAPTDATDARVDTGEPTNNTTDPGDDDDDDDVTTPPDPNQAPTADAGNDLTGLVTDEIELDGSASYDPDGDLLDYEWTLIEVPPGSTSFLINENRVDPSFYADRAGLYVVEIAVDDGEYVDTDEVEVTIDAPNEGPVANAGPDQSVDTGDRVVLNGTSSYDPDGDPLQFAWTMVTTPAGSTATLTNDTSSLPQFTADISGVYIVELIVHDGVDVSSADQIRVTAQTPSDSDCLSCATAQVELRRRWSAGNASGALGLAFLPFAVLLIQRRRT